MAAIRLLQRKASGEIVFREPTSDDTPAYAMLSHTWGKEEVVFHDIESGADRDKIMSKAGWKKIQFCADQAARDGLQYFWVDTCCIDKKNAVELGAAINSMFRWYQDAARCYVYLADVSKPDMSVANDWMWKESFKASRWFTRGWTLQELIAPLHVKFFSEEGNPLGSKLSLEQDIHEVTRIPFQALRRSRISEFEVDERMKWAARRQTTIEEDQVYCLLGIFEIFIPPIYGEGKANALSRLQEVIDRRVQAQGQKRPRDISDTPPSKKRTTPYNRFQSLPSLHPVLEIPTKEIETVLGKLPPTQHIEIAEIVTANCKLAAYRFYWEYFAVHSKGYEMPREATLREWITQTERHFHEVKGKVSLPQDDSTESGFYFKNAFDILKMLDPWKRLNALEIERSICCAIVWCRRLHDSECEARLASLWAELHPSTIDEKWSVNLERAREEGDGRTTLKWFYFPKPQKKYNSFRSETEQ